jgi:zinc transport system substrate-binding protein
MESFLDKVMKESPNIKIIDSSEGIELIKDEDCENEEGHCDHEYNPHIWVSISNYIKQVENIADGLSKIDPAHSDQYKKNTETYTAKLSTLKTKMHSELDGIKNKDIVTFHDAFPYFAKEFGLNIAGVINHEPESEPSVKELTDVIETVKKLSVKALFVEPQYPSTAANIISRETGTKIYTLDPGATGDKSKDSYINVMENNLKVLKEALN